ncbi:hypothetical protein CDO87_03430 [Sagittula sp. P11]|uniref:phage capsid protein n=1 Tax=Sagittula sp. P11 TaxID=2009329 RepID=UPI000C2D01BA|nr:phage capsid protein [Sagittula sp. P11]AUC52297.1 hypothetical protein CDO87_03430 [Sagittula sp. P11]
MAYQQLVEPHHRLTFNGNVRLVSQQMQNPLRAAVTIAQCSGEAEDIADLIDALEYLEGTDYDRRNPENVAQNKRRWLIRPTVIESGQYITKEEQFDKAQDPSSTLVRNHIKAVERGVHDRILGVRKKGADYEVAGGGIMGAVYEGKTPSSTSALPAGNYIAVDVDEPGTPAGMTLKKLRGATEAMELEDFGLESDDEIYSVITPKQKTDLLTLAFETGKNLNPFEVKNIEDGKPGKLLGINWLFSNRVAKDPNGYRLCPVWTKANVVAGFWQDVQGNMWNDTSAKNLPYVHVDAYPACGRIEDKGVRVLRCAEA